MKIVKKEVKPAIMMICLNKDTCKDEVCSHKKEHEHNGACEQHCIFSYFEKTCVQVERNKNAGRKLNHRDKKNTRGRVTNPKMPVRKQQGVSGKPSKRNAKG